MAPRKTAAQKAAEAEEAAKAETKTPAQESETQLKNRLRNEAERTVLNNHRDEYQDEAEKLFTAHGLKFNRRLSDEERAARKIEDLMSQFPELRGKYGQTTIVADSQYSDEDDEQGFDPEAAYGVGPVEDVDDHEPADA
jgi:hypothetical protein